MLAVLVVAVLSGCLSNFTEVRFNPTKAPSDYARVEIAAYLQDAVTSKKVFKFSEFSPWKIGYRTSPGGDVQWVWAGSTNEDPRRISVAVPPEARVIHIVFNRGYFKLTFDGDLPMAGGSSARVLCVQGEKNRFTCSQ